MFGMSVTIAVPVLMGLGGIAGVVLFGIAFWISEELLGTRNPLTTILFWISSASGWTVIGSFVVFPVALVVYALTTGDLYGLWLAALSVPVGVIGSAMMTKTLGY